MITIKVGPEATPFLLHKESLCHHSAYFAAATKDCWKNGTDGSPHNHDVLELKDEKFYIFAIFESWLYKQNLDELERSPNLTVPLLIDVYMFADRIQCRAFGNQIIDLLARCISSTNDPIESCMLGSRTIAHVYSKTPSNAPLRRVLIDLYAFEVDITKDSRFLKGLEDWPQEFVYEVIRTYFANCSGQHPSRKSRPYLGNFGNRYHIQNGA